jgi:iron transport multicopper oxidase
LGICFSPKSGTLTKSLIFRSIGGIFAFEAARILCQANKHVEALILIDSPCPGIIPPMSEDMIDLLDSLKLTGGHQLPRQRWHSIRAHFSGSIRALQKYTPQPLTDIWAPRCLVLWARSGVRESSSEDENTKSLSRKPGNEAHRWIMDERVNHGPNGWETLLPEVEVEVVPGDHFTIMQSPQVRWNRIGHLMATSRMILTWLRFTSWEA